MANTPVTACVTATQNILDLNIDFFIMAANYSGVDKYCAGICPIKIVAPLPELNFTAY